MYEYRIFAEPNLMIVKYRGPIHFDELGPVNTNQ